MGQNFCAVAFIFPANAGFCGIQLSPWQHELAYLLAHVTLLYGKPDYQASTTVISDLTGWWPSLMTDVTASLTDGGPQTLRTTQQVADSSLPPPTLNHNDQSATIKPQPQWGPRGTGLRGLLQGAWDGTRLEPGMFFFLVLFTFHKINCVRLSHNYISTQRRDAWCICRFLFLIF